jgi:membrane fusion protein (multidrug efflux system)
MSLNVDRTGTLRTQRDVRVFNQVEGRIELVAAYEGDQVGLGQLLVRLDASLLQAELTKARAQLKQLNLDMNRLRRLAKQRLISDEELARAETLVEIAQAEESLLKTRLGYTEIRAPFAGIITERFFKPGDVAPMHSHILTLIDPQTLYTDVEVSELLLPSLRVGGPVAVRIDALGRDSYAGKVTRIHPTVDSRTRLGRVEISLDPVPEGAHPGQLTRLHLSGEALVRLSIPFNAVRRDDSGEYVFVVNEGKAQRRTLRAGLRIADRVEILDGLQVGELVVTKGFLGLTDGKAVQRVNETAAVAK